MADPFIQDFVAESWSNLRRVDGALAGLKKSPTEILLLAEIFRTVHSLKGGATVLRLTALSRITHAVENVLDHMRSGSLDVDVVSLTLLTDSIDFIKEILTGLEATGEELAVDAESLIARLDQCAARNSTQSVKGAISPAKSVTVAAAVEQPRPTDLSTRVTVASLDRLVNLVGELVLTRNQFLQLVQSDEATAFAGAITQLDRVTSELQHSVMKTRMQPVGLAWSTLPRLVKELSRVTGKPIALELHGADTQVDRTVLEMLQDPLIHIIRNAADHGIERPEVRRAAGKSDAGRLKLDAKYEAGQVVISLEDDGEGISRRKVIQTALRQRLIPANEADTLPDADVLNLLFRPGFSTAEQITTVSGRGVGLDIVKTAMDRVGGTVELSSEPGRGLKVRLKFPQTTAIISALVVDAAGQSFAIPQPAIVEIVRQSTDAAPHSALNDPANVFRRRDRVLPLLSLAEALQIEGTSSTDQDIIVVVQVGEEQFGLMVAAVSSPQELLVKPVGAPLKHLPMYHGTTILGDGRAILILDVAALATQLGGSPSSAISQEALTETAPAPPEPTSLLLFRTAMGEVMAVPTALISRLEEFPTVKLERCSDRWVVQQRDQLLPLLSIVGSDGQVSAGESQSVIVFADGPQEFGLLVERIQDIVNEPLSIRLPSDRPGVLGTAVIGGKATDLLDAQHYLMQAFPHRCVQPELTTLPKSVLVIDDSLFFRQLVRTALEADGYRTAVVDSAQRAMDMLNNGHMFDVVLCDIEMPGINGCQFAEWFRQRSDTSDMPLVAITSLDGDLHGPRIMAAGFDRMLIKFHPQQLRQTLVNLLHRSETTVRERCA